MEKKKKEENWIDVLLKDLPEKEEFGEAGT
jgi:hypothetical protein